MGQRQGHSGVGVATRHLATWGSVKGSWRGGQNRGQGVSCPPPASAARAHVVRPFVCLSVTLVDQDSHRLEILETNSTGN